ncbi:MAG TPA: hypothetical protein VGI99_07440 [Gemmataceae bacterium]
MSTSTASAPAWLEAAAKLDAMLGDKVPLADGRAALPPTDGESKPAAESKEKPTRPAERKSAAEKPVETKPRSRIEAPPISATESSQEVEIAWRGYSPAALLPSTITLALASAITYYVVRPFVPALIVQESVDAPLLAVWMLQLIRAVYRLMAYNYRVTNRRLFRERGRLYQPEPPLDLATVARVEMIQTWFCRWAGVGKVRVVPEEAATIKLPIELTGIRKPGLLATRIEEAVKAAREGNVMAGRTPSEPRTE